VFKFIRAEELPRMDSAGVMGIGGGTGDPYIWINHMGSVLKTRAQTMETIEGSKEKFGMEKFKPVVWNQEMLLPLELPSSNDTLNFSIFD
jgi:hypothetical protein